MNARVTLEGDEYVWTEATPEERIALKHEHDIVDDEVLRSLGFDRRPRAGSKVEARAVRSLALAGWSLMAIEDFLELHEDDVEALVAPVRDAAVRLLYLAGVPTKEIAERTETDLMRISRVTSDIARRGRGPSTSRNALPDAVRESIRHRWQAAQCGVLIRRELKISATTMRNHTRDLAPRKHRCALCRPGPKPATA
ncbi:MAG: hypothetical protein KF850_24295 [Labilithrix sp.]|nr:hypothetical protein [Labilithrix sp.]